MTAYTLTIPRLVIPGVTREALLVLGLILVWMLPGLIGREPWKADEAYTLGLIKHVVDSGDWVVPTLAGEPFMEKPPIYFITAAMFAQLLGGWLSLPDAARLANPFFLGLTAWALSVAAAGIGVRRLDTILAMFGCLGLTVTAHYLITDLALLAGVAMGLAGLTLSASRWPQASLWLGLGAGLAFLSKGLIGPGILGLTALALPLVDRHWRSRAHLLTCLLALLLALPAVIIWPMALWLRSPALLHEWFWDNNIGRFTGLAGLGPKPDFGGYLNYLGHGALPLWPLILFNIRHWAGTWRAGRIAPSVVLLVVGVSVLSLAAEARVVYILPLLPALALIAMALPDEFLGWRWGHLCLSAMGLSFVACLWAGALQLDGVIAKNWSYSLFANWVGLPAIVAPEFSLGRYLLAALAATILVPLMLAPGMAGRSGFLRSWAAALALFWGSFILLFQPWLAAGNDYRKLMGDIADQTRPFAGECILSIGLGESQRALLDYYAGIRTVRTERLEAGRFCNLLLIQHRASCAATIHQWHGWTAFWRNSRPGDQGECLVLYKSVME